MLKDNIKSISNQPCPSIEKGSITKKLIEFIEDTLLIFHNQFKGEIDASEEVLNEHLGKTLNYQSKKLPFFFQQETIQNQTKGQNRKVDIGVFKHFAEVKPFFTIEAKRLTTALSKSREKEYVVGINPKKLSGGIERFKHNVHGTDLAESALVGYIQTDDPKHWFTKINDWINEFIDQEVPGTLDWSSNDLLSNICGFNDNRVTKSSSLSKKTNKARIHLNHYFINMTAL